MTGTGPAVLQRADRVGESNRAVGEGIGLPRLKQAGDLLARLADEGLLVKQAGGPGRPNAWSLTPHGERVARALEEDTHSPTEIQAERISVARP